MKGIDRLRLRATPDGVIVPVKAVPGCSRDRLVGVLGSCLKIATAAPAEKGRANAAVAASLAAALGVDGRAVSLVAGQTHPRKEFLVAGLTTDQARDRLNRVQ